MKTHRAILLALALAASACGRTNDESATTTSPPTRRATENDINPIERDRLQDGGKLTWALDSMPVNFNYYQIDGTERNQFYIIAAMMPAVYTADASGTPHWNRELLASEPVLVTDPTQVVTYAIHPKAAWSDGTPITWQDFYWQWKSSNGSDKAYQISSSNGYDQIGTIARGRDDREVVVTFTRKFADWPSLFNPFYPASTNKSPKTFNEGWKNGPLAVAGPFTLAGKDDTAKTVTLVRNDKWWGPPAKLDTIVFRAIEPDAQIDALANGEVDLMDLGSDPNKYTRAKALGDVELRIGGGPNFTHVTFNGTAPQLSDVRVRQAVAMGINRAAIVRAMLTPLGLDPQTLNNHIFMANQAGYRDNSGDVGKYDSAGAARLLDEAGWALDDGVRKKQGRPLDVSFVIPSGVATSRQVAELIQNMLQQIGVKVTITTVPINDFFEKYITPGQFDLTLFSWIGTAYPISSAKSLYAQPVTTASGDVSIQQNYARIGSDALDRLFATATQELDRTKAIELGNQIDAAIWQEVHSLTVYQRPEIIPVRRGLANIGAFGFADIVYEDIGWVKRN